ncbi:Bloom syndrome protein -like protein [Caligus rogercresseyi]|uniref:Bloom syndrome protein -like protein n=1 Tax=Caligus rogercresseyi TaxID=217165 RepID=A0A7T8QTB4_CALRO|nr:Bloom syndrome protein -like protein [Caligus rogercresseyi]
MPKRDYSFSNNLFGKLKSHFDTHSFRLNHVSAINAALLNNVTSFLMPTEAERVSAIMYPPRSRAESL